jgi:hypothetical protein
MKVKMLEKIAKAVVDDGEACDIATVERLLDSLDAEGQAWLASADETDVVRWAIDTLINTQPPLD